MQAPYKDDKVAEAEAFIPDSEGHEVPRKRLTSSKAALAFSLLLAAVLGFLTASTWTFVESLPPKKLTCGNSTAEAKALGCQFDMLAAGWVPAPCIDKKSDDDYKAWILNSARREGPFPYFKDQNFTQSLHNLEELSHYTDTIFTTVEEHLGHCTQLMARIHRVAIEGGRKARIITDKDETGVISTMHVHHCVKILWEHATDVGHNVKEPPNFTKFSVNYLTC